MVKKTKTTANKNDKTNKGKSNGKTKAKVKKRKIKKKKFSREPLVLIINYSDHDEQEHDVDDVGNSNVRDEYSEYSYESDVFYDISQLSHAHDIDSSNADVNYLIKEIEKRDNIISKLTANENNNNNTVASNKKIVSQHNDSIKYHDSCKMINVDTGECIAKDVNEYRCWYCGCNFDWLSLHIPCSYEDGVFYVFGIVCSWQCKMAYSIKRINDNKQRIRMSLIKKMYYESYGNNDIDDMEMAGSPELLHFNGGPLSEDEYRYKYKITPTINIPPTIKQSPMIHAITIYDNEE